MSSRTNALGRGSQAFHHTVGCLTFADKGIGPGGERRLLTGIQMADEDNDDRGRAGHAQFGQIRAGPISE